jgi:hypothetical protein
MPDDWYIEEWEMMDLGPPIWAQNEEIKRRHDISWGESYPFKGSLQYFPSKQFSIETECKEPPPEGFMCAGFLTTVSQNGIPVYTIDHGGSSGLSESQVVPHKWEYDNNWMIEIRIEVDNSNCMNEDVIFNGQSMNEQYGYSRSFSLQLLDGKPFFFFKKYGYFGYSYDFVEYKLGYTDIWYECCCMAASSNPTMYEYAVWFEAERDREYVYVIMGHITPP